MAQSSRFNLAHRLLSDLHGAAFEEVLIKLSSQDHASLRQVSKAVSSNTTYNLPYIVLRLTNSSTKEQLRQWFKATSQLQHISGINITVSGRIADEVFEEAMQLLSKRTSIINLKMSPLEDDDGKHQLYLATLKPVAYMIHQLTELSVLDIAVRDVMEDLQYLTATAAAAATTTQSPPQLQKLALHAESSAQPHWSQAVEVLQNLSTTFGLLKTLDICLPDLQYRPETVSARDLNAAVVAPASDTEDDSEDQDDADADAAEASDNEVDLAPVDTARGLQMQQAQVATVAALANAAIKLTRLEQVSVRGLPDIWRPSAAEKPAAITAVAELERRMKRSDASMSDAAVDATDGRLLNTTTAAAAFVSLDSMGCWLLRHHSRLQDVSISIVGSWGMSWVLPSEHLRQQSQHAISCVDNNCADHESDAAAAAGPRGSQTRWHLHGAWTVPYRSLAIASDATSSLEAASAAATIVATKCNRSVLLPEFMDYMSYYSTRPALWQHVIRCCLDIHLAQINDMADLLADMKCLKMLQITLQKPTISSTEAAGIGGAAVLAVRAAAAVQSLERFEFVSPDKVTVCATDDLLLPLTDAAGGPGSRLKVLKLTGKFEPIKAMLPNRALKQLDPEGGGKDYADKLSAAAAMIPLNSRWHGALRLLDGLTELVINHEGNTNCQTTLTLLVASLPASLEVLTCSHMNILGHDAACCGSAVTDTFTGGITTTAEATGLKLQGVIGSQSSGEYPQLQKLVLKDCSLSSVTMLSSRQLQQLKVLRTHWPGGWAAAAIAWPNVRVLTWKYASTFARGSCLYSSSNTDITTAGSNKASLLGVGSDAAAAAAVVDAADGGATCTGPWLTQAKATESPFKPFQVFNHVPLDTLGPSVQDHLADVLSLFKHLSCLTVSGLPRLSVDILECIETPYLKKLHHVDFDISQTIKRQHASQAGAGAVAEQGLPNDKSSSGNDAKVIAQWLHQQLPWANVA